MGIATKIVVGSAVLFIFSAGIGAMNGIGNGLSLTKRPLEESLGSKSQIVYADNNNMSMSNLNYTSFQKKIPEPENIEIIMDRHLKGKLNGLADSFIRYGEIYEVDPVLLAAISIHETGNGSSKAIVNLKNAGGIMSNPSKGILRQFISVNASIEYMAWLLRTSYMNGRNKYSIEDIGNMYCPEGVANDPTGLNQHWIPAVKRIYKEITGVDYTY